MFYIDFCLNHELTTMCMPWQPPTYDTTMRSPSPGVTRLEFPGVCAQQEKCHACGVDRDSSWRSEVDRMLNQLLSRVAGVEDTLRNVVEGVANLRGELQVHAAHHVSKDSGGPSNNVTVDIEAAHVDVRVDSASGRHKCTKEISFGGNVGQVATAVNTELQEDPQPDASPGAQLGHPILVDEYNGSSPSEDSETSADVRFKRTPAPPVTTPNSVGKRVHSQPRARVVPCARPVLGVAAGPSKGETLAEAAPSKTTIAYKYKDPPGYEGVTDFGTTEEPYFKPPLLQPKKKGVKYYLSLPSVTVNSEFR